MIFSVISLFAITSTFGVSFDCNYIDMGFNVIQPVGQCVIGKNTANKVMSMEHLCVDEYTLQSRIYSGDSNCNGNNYEIINTFDCNSNSTFVKCDCSFNNDNAKCSLVQDIQYIKDKDGECDKDSVIEHRTYIVEDDQIPKSFIDNNCFERKSDNKSLVNFCIYFMHEIIITTYMYIII